MSELVFKPALELGRLLKKKKLSAMELLGECLTQYARHNDAINAVILTDLSRGRAAARAADKRLAAGEALRPLENHHQRSGGGAELADEPDREFRGPSARATPAPTASTPTSAAQRERRKKCE